MQKKTRERKRESSNECVLQNPFVVVYYRYIALYTIIFNKQYSINYKTIAV